MSTKLELMEKFSMADFYEDIWSEIISFLDMKTLLNISETSTYFYKLANRFILFFLKKFKKIFFGKWNTGD
jgi:hypothetical protein